MLNRNSRDLLVALPVIVSLWLSAEAAPASQADAHLARAEHAVAGAVRKVDHAAKTFVIETAEGVHETARYTGDTLVHGVTSAASAVDARAKDTLEGAWAILHYTGDGAHKTAVAIDSLGGRTVKVARGEVVRIDEAAAFLVIKTKAGGEETFDLARHVVVDAGRGVERGTTATCHAIEQGVEVAISYSKTAGNKTAVVVKRI